MAEAFTKPYLDANVYIALIKGPQTEDPQRVQLAAEIFQLAESGAFPVYASTFIEAEVIKPPGESSPLSPQQESKIEAYFDRDFIVWIELDRPIARKSRQLSRDFGLKPADAVHVATALRGGCDQFLTWDEKLHKSGRTFETVYACPPHLTGRQASLIPIEPSESKDD